MRTAALDKIVNLPVLVKVKNEITEQITCYFGRLFVDLSDYISAHTGGHTNTTGI